MKSFIFKSTLILACFALTFGCQKETGLSNGKQNPAALTQSNKDQDSKPVKRAYHDSFTVVLKFVPDFRSGWTPADAPAPVWYPGTGRGNATHMGNATTYFNNHTVRAGDGTVMVYSAPVGMFFAKEVAPFGIKPTDNIWMVNVDDKGNSIWFGGGPGPMPSYRIGTTPVVAMDGKVSIVNGTGKFAGATGELTFHAMFDQASLDTASWTFKVASVWQDGWIRY